MTGFCLSEKRKSRFDRGLVSKRGIYYQYEEEDVKEFIKLLKEMKGIEHDGSFISISAIREFIDALAGEDLT